MHPMHWSLWLDAAIATSALGLAIAIRPWRALPASGPPWPWLAWLAVMPVLWGVDGPSGMALAQPMSGACLLTLMAGWPLAVLGLVPTALLTGWWVGLPLEAVLQRGVWLGVVPASVALVLGAALRRWLPNHLFIYILGRGFLVTTVAGVLAALGRMLLHPVPSILPAGDVLLARVLTASGDAFITGMLVAMFVAYRPQWLATYADRIYLPATPRG